MAPQRPEDGFVRMPEHEFEATRRAAGVEVAKVMLAATKLRGERFDNPDGAATLRWSADDGAPFRLTVSENADAFARDLAPVVEATQAEGAFRLWRHRRRAV